MQLTWEEACSYVWHASQEGGKYYFSLEGDDLYYRRTPKGATKIWGSRYMLSPQTHLIEAGFTVLGGLPKLSLQEQVCRKIMQMESRRREHRAI